MITPMAASFRDARSDFGFLQRVGLASTAWSTKTLSGQVTEYVAFNDPAKQFEGGVKEAVIHFYADTDKPLTGKQATEALKACRPRRDGPCHYVFSAEAYSDDFAARVEELAGPDATVTLIERSIMERWNEDRFALHRLTIAQHALADDRPSHLFLYEIGDPCDFEGVSNQFGNILYKVCGMAVDYHHDVGIVEGVKENWAAAAHDMYIDGQVGLALTALDIATGAVEGLFAELEVDPDVTGRTLEALRAARNAAAAASERPDD